MLISAEKLEGRVHLQEIIRRHELYTQCNYTKQMQPTVTALHQSSVKRGTIFICDGADRHGTLNGSCVTLKWERRGCKAKLSRCI